MNARHVFGFYATALCIALGLGPGTINAQPREMAIAQAVADGAIASASDFNGILVVCNGGAVAARAGMRLAPNCIVESGGTTVIATVNDNQAEIQAEPGTQLDFLPDGIRVVLGRVFVKVRSLSLRSWFKVETRHGTASLRSTQFDVQVARERAVFRLFEGSLDVRARASSERVIIGPGQRADILGSTQVEARAMTRAEIDAVVRRVRRTEDVLQRQASVNGSFANLRIPDLQPAPTPPALAIDQFLAAGRTLRWQTRNAVRVDIQGLGQVPASGSRRVNPSRTTTYTLVAAGRDGKRLRRSTTVRVEQQAPPPRIDYFRSAGNALEWSVSNAQRVTISGIGNVALSGRRAVSPGRYTLSASTNRAVVTSDPVVVQEAVLLKEFLKIPLPGTNTGNDGIEQDPRGSRPSGGIIRGLPQ